jgi:hypothetical protein
VKPLALLALAAVFLAAPAEAADELERDGLHAQIAFGWGGGPTGNGLLHNMELGHTYDNGWTLAYQHIFVMRFDESDGRDIYGGHLLLAKAPLLFDQVVVKMGFGFGENVDRRDGFDAKFGVGHTLGLDLHYPVWPTSGVTISAMMFQIYTVDVGYQVAAGGALAYTWF